MHIKAYWGLEVHVSPPLTSALDGSQWLHTHTYIHIHVCLYEHTFINSFHESYCHNDNRMWNNTKIHKLTQFLQCKIPPTCIFWLIDLNTLSFSLKAAFSIDIPFLKPCYSVTSCRLQLLHTRCTVLFKRNNSLWYLRSHIGDYWECLFLVGYSVWQGRLQHGWHVSIWTYIICFLKIIHK